MAHERLPFQNPDRNPAAGPVGKDLPEVFDRMRNRPNDVQSYAVVLKDGDAGSRLKAAEMLGETGDPAGVPPLIDALLDQSIAVQYVAAKSLGTLADPRAAGPLRALLASDNHWIRRAAACALGSVGDRQSITTLVTLLTDPHHDVRACAAWSLGKLGDIRVLDALRPLLADPRADVRREAEAAMKLLSGDCPEEAGRPMPGSKMITITCIPVRGDGTRDR